MPVAEFGLECYDANGLKTLTIDHTVARLVYDAEVAAGVSDSTTVAELDGKSSAEFGICLETDKCAHYISRSGTTITWTARSDEFYIIPPGDGPFGWPSGNTHIFVFLYD